MYEGILINHFGNVDEFGNPVKRTKQSHPYGYDGFVTWRGGKNEEANQTAYSDRLSQEDYDKNRSLKKKHLGFTGDSFYGVAPEKIESYLRDFLNRPNLKLIFIMEYCHGNGNPYWRFDFHA